jgi:hypothetical protein
MMTGQSLGRRLYPIAAEEETTLSKLPPADPRPSISVTAGGRLYRQGLGRKRYLLLVIACCVICGLVIAAANMIHANLALFVSPLVGWALVQILLLHPGQVTGGRELVVLASPLISTGSAVLFTRLVCALFTQVNGCSSRGLPIDVLFSAIEQYVIVIAAVIWLRLARVRSKRECRE